MYSDGIVRSAVYDPQRRWFSEVLRIFEGASYPYYRIFAAAGNNPTDTLTGDQSVVQRVDPGGLRRRDPHGSGQHG